MLFALLIIFSSSNLHAAAIARMPLHGVSLYTPEMWQIARAAKAQYEACTVEITQKLVQPDICNPPKKRHWDLRAFDQPSPNGVRVGILRAELIPKSGFQFFYKAEGWGRFRRFQPDVHCPYFTSDCLAEHTILDQQGDWLLLPAGPANNAFWVNPSLDWGSSLRVRPIITAGRSYRLGRSMRATRQTNGNNQFLHYGDEIFVKKITDGFLLVRRAQAGDEKCRPLDKAPLGEEAPEYKISFGELYDGRGHLRLKPAYADYCPDPAEKEQNLKIKDPSTP